MAKLTASTDVSNFLAAADKAAARATIEAAHSSAPTIVTAEAAYEVPVPSGTPAAGDKAKFYITASGDNRDLTLATGIRVPSDSAITFPKTLTSGQTYIVQLEYLGSFWMLTTVVGGGV
jgi:hypothetical protein